jgi:predicted HTH domain antitoxin
VIQPASSKLGVQTQSIEAFVRTVLPRFFDKDGPLDGVRHSLLITELSEHPTLLNDASIRQLLGSLPIVPTQDELWSIPTNTYRRTDDLVKVLGDNSHLWLDSNRIPNLLSVHNFLDSLGIRRSPSARHLVERMLAIAKDNPPTDVARHNSGEAFYALCDNYDIWKGEESFSEALEDLRNHECFPAEGDEVQWYYSNVLYAPYRAEAFKSQAGILDFRSAARLKSDLLKDLGITIEPETRLVIDHLMKCVEKNIKPSDLVYIVLNERTQKSDPLISTIAGNRCIFVNSDTGFVQPSRVYWTKPQLGRYAFSIPRSYELYRPLFTAIGVKDSPSASDLVDILLDIVRENDQQSKPITGTDRAVYDLCLAGIAQAFELSLLGSADLSRMEAETTLLNLLDLPQFPHDLLLRDSEWIAGFFDSDLDLALCRPSSEIWPLLRAIGVKRLSECASMSLEMMQGEMADESELAASLKDRIDVFIRVLHDKPTSVVGHIRDALSELTAVSYDSLRIRVTIDIDGRPFDAPLSPTDAFYDVKHRQLSLARPLRDGSWPHILKAVFHQLMPEESGSEIAKLTLGVRHLMTMSVEEAQNELTDAGIPLLEFDTADTGIDISSSQLDDIRSETEQEECRDPNSGTEIAETGHEVGRSRESSTESKLIGERATDNEIEQGGSTKSTNHETFGASKPVESQYPAETASAWVPTSKSSGARDQDHDGRDKHLGESRTKHKNQRNQRLLSYVRNKGDGPADAQDSENAAREHNLEVERVARLAVCEYERQFGRTPEEMPQTYPGYDIISRNSQSGEERIIEVKGISGEWNQTGVGLSRHQFREASERSDSYWLYVVEFALDRKPRVHPIQDPAGLVALYMFDCGWREAVEADDPADAFVLGARVMHNKWGVGRIESLQVKGSARVMSINFDKWGIRTVTLNLRAMELAEENHGDDAS